MKEQQLKDRLTIKLSDIGLFRHSMAAGKESQRQVADRICTGFTDLMLKIAHGETERGDCIMPGCCYSDEPMVCAHFNLDFNSPDCDIRLTGHSRVALEKRLRDVGTWVFSNYPCVPYFGSKITTKTVIGRIFR